MHCFVEENAPGCSSENENGNNLGGVFVRMKQRSVTYFVLVTLVLEKAELPSLSVPAFTSAPFHPCRASWCLEQWGSWIPACTTKHKAPLFQECLTTNLYYLLASKQRIEHLPHPFQARWGVLSDNSFHFNHMI